MRITNLEILNFRGIQKASIAFPLDTRIICIIGAGDTTKSTLLKAIEWAFWPSWNLTAFDTDFHHSDTSTPIIIRATVTNVPERFISEDKYGFYMRRPGVDYSEGIDDEPKDDQPQCLTIQLTINSSLEPKWEVVCNRQEPKHISPTDRKLLAVGVVGDNCAKDLVWGKYSVLQRYADAKETLRDAYISSLRNVVKNTNLSALNEISVTLASVGKKYGVNFENAPTSKLLFQGSSFSTTVGLFDGDSPLNQLGNGSQRLLSMGLNIGVTPNGALLIVDEIESGLEPYRLRSLINELRSMQNGADQVILTTHSPVVVAECSSSELMVAHSANGETRTVSPKSDDKNVDGIIQRHIRANSEALLSKKIIVCEGKTEIGFLKAYDNFLSRAEKFRMAYEGIGIADGQGENLFECAKVFHDCGYETCVLMDSDVDTEETKKEQLRELGIPVFDWDKPNAIEEEIFSALPISALNLVINTIIENRGLESMKSVLTSNSINYTERDGSIFFPEAMTQIQKQMLGGVAKNKAWFKRIGLGIELGNIVFDNWDVIDSSSALKRVIKDLSEWMQKNDRTGTE